MRSDIQVIKRRVRDLHRMNLSPSEIADTLGVTKARVYQLLSELRCKPNPVRRSRETL